MGDSLRPADDLLAYYASGAEPERLGKGSGTLEFARTTEIILRRLPQGAVVADVGGADGRYATWLTDRGHRVHLVDAIPSHVELARERAGDPPRFAIHEADARALPLADDSVDAVLLLGPLYHLGERAERIRALQEAARVCRPGGVVFAAAISRFAPLLDAIRRGLVRDERLFANVLDEASTGRRVAPERRTSPFPDAYFHRPEELENELVDAGLVVEGIVGVQGPGWLLAEDDDVWADDGARQRLVELARLVEAEPLLLGVSAHLLAVASNPAAA